MNKNKLLIWSIVIIVFGLIIYLLFPKSNNYELNTRGEYFHDYKENEVQNIIVSLEEVAERYLSDLVNDCIYFDKDVYEKLDDEMLMKYPTYEEFKEYLNKLKTVKFLNAKVKSYSRILVGNKNAILVIDSDNNEITFIEESINNVKVRIN